MNSIGCGIVKHPLWKDAYASARQYRDIVLGIRLPTDASEIQCRSKW